MLYNKQFLKQLDENRTKTIYARVIALQLDESPIETIEGRVIQGSINIDGDSAVRRTCSLTLVAEQFDYNEFIWGLNTKFKLEIGVENTIDSTYPNIIWFKQGTYIISSFSTSHSTNNFSISINGKDKMCGLNGELGGVLTSSVDFGTVEDVITLSDGSKATKITHLNIQDIIRNIVHLYGGEPLHNIIINDLDISGLELLEYRYDTPMYLYREAHDNSDYDNVTLQGRKVCQVLDSEGNIIRSTTLSELATTELEMLVNPMTGSATPSVVRFPNEAILADGSRADVDVYVAKVSYGETAGYRFTDLTYPGDLIGAVGEALTSILDKIKIMLGDFEYFYDLDGQFIFQKKKTIDIPWSPLSTNDGQHSLNYEDEIAYTFNGGKLVTTFNNNPQLANVKNDYSVWGERVGVSGKALPVHMRYAIDKKPIYYKTLDNKIYTTDEETFRALLAAALDDVKANYFNKINSFERVHETPAGLTPPEKQDNGTWTAGWWEIRDWYNYYALLTNEFPNYTMKWYSCNDETGCIPIKTIPGYESNPGYCWLIIKRADGTYNFQHGSGNPTGTGRNCTLYESSYDLNDPTKYTTAIVKDENGDAIKKMFIPPYSGCSDDHTYIEFLEDNIKRQGSQVFFYNPKFPKYDSTEDLIEDQLQKELDAYLASGMLNFVDWREIIYQMAKDYYANSNNDEFTSHVANQNALYYPSGQTGYENYYIDLLGFWRDLYNPEMSEIEHHNLFIDPYKTEEEQIAIVQKDINSIITLLKSDTNNTAKKQELRTKQELLAKMKNYLIYYYQGDRKYWSKTVYEAPQNLNFWFDFLDTEGELSQFSVKNIGCRPKAINDSSVKAIYFRETPNVVFTTNFEEDRKQSSAYTYINAGKAGMNTMFSISSQGKSAKAAIDDLVYRHGYCIETATINTIPIYYLEPNVRIHIVDESTNLDGYYNVSKLSIPLTYNGTMSITATKAAESI